MCQRRTGHVQAQSLAFAYRDPTIPPRELECHTLLFVIQESEPSRYDSYQILSLAVRLWYRENGVGTFGESVSPILHASQISRNGPLPREALLA